MEYETRCGESVPVVGLGTWQMDHATAEEAVSTALTEGYRHVDTAQVYGNEQGVGRAIQAGAVDREEVFLTTKVNPTHTAHGEIVESVTRSLDLLGTDYVDLLLIHWPNPLADLGTVMGALDEAVDEGMARFIGVSNFGRDRLERARDLATEPIFTDQVLMQPWWPQRDLLRYCQSEDVLLTAYSPLANGSALDDDLLSDIGSRYGKTGPQVALRWSTQHENVLTIPMSTSAAHIAENVDIFDFMLTREEHDAITRPSYLKTGLAMFKGQLPV